MVKAIVVEELGGTEVLKLKEIKIGAPGPGQALVRIAVAGVNFFDVYQRRGTFFPGQTPFVPGLEGAGTVEAVGADVTNVKIGDRVAYTEQPGSYAEANLVRASSLIPVPNDITFEQAAAFPLQGLTAHYLIHEFREPKPRDVVLIHAAAGGVGLLLVQLARHLGAHHLGAHVIGTVSTDEKARAAKEAGATDVINYVQQDFVSGTKRLSNGHGADLILDGVGKTTFARNFDAVAPRGHIVLFGAPSGPPDPISPSLLWTRSFSVSGGSLGDYLRTRGELLDRASNLIQGIRERWLKLKLDKVLPLAQAAEAHRLLESRQTIGKLLLSVRTPN